MSRTEASHATPVAAVTQALRIASLCLTVQLGACRAPQADATVEVLDPSGLPVQAALEPPLPAFGLTVGDDHFSISPRARYSITARVLSRERYYWGWRGRVSPLDLALGWGDMADPRVDTWIEWSQNDRWYFWQWRAGSPYQNAQIRVQSSNVHLIPANTNLKRALLDVVAAQDIVLLEGLLVDLDAPEGDHWSSSLSRNDTGNHACELMYVERVVVHQRAYR